MNAADHGASSSRDALIATRELVEPRPQLEIDVQPDPGRLFDEERQSLVEGRQLRRHRPQRLQQQPANAPRAAPWLTSSR